MATEIKRQRVRQGNFIDLPNLASGEFGYAVDQSRLFIGNTEIVKPNQQQMLILMGLWSLILVLILITKMVRSRFTSKMVMI